MICKLFAIFAQVANAVLDKGGNDATFTAIDKNPALIENIAKLLMNELWFITTEKVQGFTIYSLGSKVVAIGEPDGATPKMFWLGQQVITADCLQPGATTPPKTRGYIVGLFRPFSAGRTSNIILVVMQEGVYRSMVVDLKPEELNVISD